MVTKAQQDGEMQPSAFYVSTAQMTAFKHELEDVLCTNLFFLKLRQYMMAALLKPVQVKEW